MKAVFTKFTNDTNWVAGKVGKYLFEAKLFDDPSSYGIGNGRVSKLSIYDEKERVSKKDFLAACIVNYDRGWDIEPQEKHLSIYVAVLALLESSPKRFENDLNNTERDLLTQQNLS